MLKATQTPTHHDLYNARCIGEAGAPDAGPTLVCVGAQHGNEPSGVEAAKRVIDEIHRRELPMRGAVIGLVGNLAALRNNARFLEQDLNRMWTADRVHAIRSGLVEDDFLERLVAERHEQAALIQNIDHVIAEAGEPAHFLDLHTTSAPSAPFVVIGDTLPNRDFARLLPVAAILGVEEVLEGTLPDYLTHRGCPALGFEAGQHDDPLSIELHEAAIWIALAGLNIIPRGRIPNFDDYHAQLAGAAADLPEFLEVRDHHRVHDGDQFRMQPGFRNFQRITAGERLAADRRRTYDAMEDGHIFMPLYQSLGEDGYFIVRAIPRFWLRISRLMRRMKLERILKLLPAATRDDQREDAFIIDESRAGTITWNLLHALGYRRGRRIDGRLVAARDLFDLGVKRRTRLVSCTNKPLRLREDEERGEFDS